MESIDKELEQRVWQRVCQRPGEASREDELTILIARRLGLAAEYARLSRQTPNRATFSRLEKTVRKQALCLVGLYKLTAGDVSLSPLPPEGRNQNALRRCIREELRFLKTCAGETGEWEPVFSALAQQSRESLLWLLEILGSQSGSSSADK